MRRFLAALILMVAANGAQAGFKNDYSSWKELNFTEQEHYVMGLVDGNLMSFYEPKSWQEARQSAMMPCFTTLKVSSMMLVEAITDHYKAYPGDWWLSPSFVFEASLNKICLNQINSSRKDVGLPPITPSEGSISKAFSK